jgi:hypothetical protein
MDENWTVNDSSAVKQTQGIWDALAAGDPGPATEASSEAVVFDNGPGAGPWRHTEGMAEYIEMISGFYPLFGDTFRQEGTCVFANEQFTITLVSELGVHATSGDTFDNRAIYVNRIGADGKVDHIWTVDLDSEDMEAFWRKNPVEKT